MESKLTLDMSHKAHKPHRIEVRCPECDKKGHILTDLKMNAIRIQQYSCGHTVTIRQVQVLEEDKYTSISNRDKTQFLMPKQIEAIKKAEEANLRFMILDDKGCGKMVDGVAILRLHPELRPALVVCKSRLRRQWFKHLVLWGGDVNGIPNIIPTILESAREVPDFSDSSVFVTSWDMLRSARWAGDPEIGGKFKLIIGDEIQMVKNVKAKRTMSTIDFMSGKPHIVGLTGTLTENNAAEAFPFLHILKPDEFPSYEGFINKWVSREFDSSGRKHYASIRRPMRPQWREVLDKISIRRTLADFFPDYPPIFRQYEYYDMTDEMKETYKKEVERLDQAYQHWEMTGGNNIESWAQVQNTLFRMSHLAGIAKVDNVMELLQEFLDETDEKLAVYYHHHDVGNLYNVRLENALRDRRMPPPVYLHPGVSEKAMQRLVDEEFVRGRRRVLIGRIMAEGEGLNLTGCRLLVIAERRFNPSKEEQVEGRALGFRSQGNKIRAIYPTAIGTTDEWQTEMVEAKRKYCKETYGNESELELPEGTVMKDLAAYISSQGRQKWDFTKMIKEVGKPQQPSSRLAL